MKRKTGGLELVTVLIVAGHVVDSTGVSATGPDEFRQRNKVLEPDDVMLTLDKITGRE
ncbi:hypothetical protein ACIBG5_12175 [Kribbella sp. NPDC050241]|uniref:hypothetical protein n=1 Tax=Kribbella sp. NPDC050241 TaxID=3364115 RepID=UPI0037B3FBFE